MITTIPNGVKFQKGAGLSGYIAEINAAFCCASLGIVPTVRHADYIGSWLDVLRARQSRHRPRGIAGKQGRRLAARLRVGHRSRHGRR